MLIHRGLDILSRVLPCLFLPQRLNQVQAGRFADRIESEKDAYHDRVDGGKLDKPDGRSAKRTKIPTVKKDAYSKAYLDSFRHCANY